MFFDLNVPISRSLLIATNATANTNKKSKDKGKGKEKQVDNEPEPAFSAASIATIEAKVDMLVHLGYTGIAFNQIVQTRVDPKKDKNYLDPLLKQLKPRPGIIYLKRLTIVLDSDSEKGFGLTTNNTSFFNTFDILSLLPTTQPTLALACLTHSQPSNLTTHIISLPLSLPRLPFALKHTLVRSALRNGAVFEIGYCAALGGEPPDELVTCGAAEGGAQAKRNWWAAAREVVRVTKGKGILLSGGGKEMADMRAPRDAANLLSILGLAQDASHAARTAVPKTIVLRAQGRKTYRAILSDPVVVIPPTVATAGQPVSAPALPNTASQAPAAAAVASTSAISSSEDQQQQQQQPPPEIGQSTANPTTAALPDSVSTISAPASTTPVGGSKKRPRDEIDDDAQGVSPSGAQAGAGLVGTAAAAAALVGGAAPTTAPTSSVPATGTRKRPREEDDATNPPSSSSSPAKPPATGVAGKKNKKRRK